MTRTRARYRLIAGAMIAGAWTLVAIVSTGQWYFFRLSSGRPAPWPSALVDNLISCWLWALLHAGHRLADPPPSARAGAPPR